MALKGKLEDFGITQLLNLINLARKTGTLYIAGSEKEAYLCFREGRLIYVSMAGVDDYLPVILQRAGIFTEDHVRMIRKNMPGKTDQDIARVLITSGHLKQQGLLRLVREHILGLVFQVFSWNQGAFRFEPSELPVQGRITASIALENVIMEGSRRLKEWELLSDELPDLGIALKFAERPTTPLRDINLSVEEWRVISFINPRNTIRQIANYNNMDELQIRKIVYSLLQASLVEIVRSPRPLSAPVETQAPASDQVAKPDPQAEPQMRRPAVKRGIIQRLIRRIREL
ncbi:MAG: DUF4388 domain-containing protein [Anaerolineae bacterium]|nr:DUF4388 domain-containing protein [Anaerolineae bacterium]